MVASLKSRQGPEKGTPNRGSKPALEAVIAHGFCGSCQLRKAGPSHTQKLFMELARWPSQMRGRHFSVLEVCGMNL